MYDTIKESDVSSVSPKCAGKGTSAIYLVGGPFGRSMVTCSLEACGTTLSELGIHAPLEGEAFEDTFSSIGMTKGTVALLEEPNKSI